MIGFLAYVVLASLTLVVPGLLIPIFTRTFVDGHTSADKFRANYNCNPPKHP